MDWHLLVGYCHDLTFIWIGLKDMSQSLSHCCRLSRSSWSCLVSSMLEMERYIRQSSANILVVEGTAASKSLMNTGNNRGQE